MEKTVRQIVREAFNLALKNVSVLSEAKLNKTPEEAARILMAQKDTPDYRVLKYGSIDDNYLNEVLNYLVDAYKANPSQELAWAIAAPFGWDSMAMKKIILSIVNNQKKGFEKYNIYNENFRDIFTRAWVWTFTTQNERTGEPALSSILRKSYEGKDYGTIMEVFNESIQDSSLSDEFKIIAFEYYLHGNNPSVISQKNPDIFPTPEDVQRTIGEFKQDRTVISLGKQAFRESSVPESGFLKFDPLNPEALFAKKEGSLVSKLVISMKNNAQNATRGWNTGKADVSLDAKLGGSEDDDAASLGDKLKSGSGEYNPELQGFRGHDASQSTVGDVVSGKSGDNEGDERIAKLGKVYTAFSDLVEFSKSIGAPPIITTAAEEVYVNGLGYEEIAAKYPTLYPNQADVRTALKRYITMLTGKKLEPETAKILARHGVPARTWAYSKEADDEVMVPTLEAVPPKLFFKSGEHETGINKKMKTYDTQDAGKKAIWEDINEEEINTIYEIIKKRLKGL